MAQGDGDGGDGGWIFTDLITYPNPPFTLLSPSGIASGPDPSRGSTAFRCDPRSPAMYTGKTATTHVNNFRVGVRLVHSNFFGCGTTRNASVVYQLVKQTNENPLAIRFGFSMLNQRILRVSTLVPPTAGTSTRSYPGLGRTIDRCDWHIDWAASRLQRGVLVILVFQHLSSFNVT